MWERMQPSANGALDATYLATVDAAVQAANVNNAVAILDAHNYARYNGQLASSDALASLWSHLAEIYASNPNVWFGIMNEPHNIDTTTWFGVAQAAVNAIRTAGAKNKITVPGNCFTGAHNWVSGQCDTGVPNAQAAISITDPADNFVFDMHQYLDQDFSGTNGQECVQDGPAVLADATKWLRANGKQAIIGEIGVTSSSACLSALEVTLGYLDDNSDVWVGYTYWAAGPAWGGYPYSVESTSTGTDLPQQAILNKHSGAGGGTVAPAPPFSTTGKVASVSTHTTAAAPQTSAALAPASSLTSAVAPDSTQAAASAPASTQVSAAAPTTYTQTSTAAAVVTEPVSTTQSSASNPVIINAKPTYTAPTSGSTSPVIVTVTTTPAHSAVSTAAPVVTKPAVYTAQTTSTAVAPPVVATTPIYSVARSSAAPVVTGSRRPKCSRRR
ncbi:hypothetical protein HK101_001615 [Irineochytrium annulatum]|nr:hypothetical protein HK101_001615 [Irineochytrium annulatum]